LAIPVKGIIKRAVKIYGLPAPVNVLITEAGIEMSAPGKRTKLYASWDHVVKGMLTPNNVPSFLADKPVEFLRHQLKESAR
jgi:hypothetical protein